MELVSPIFLPIGFTVKTLEREETIFLGSPLNVSCVFFILNQLLFCSSSSASASLIRSYTRSFNGFVAKLTQKEADRLTSEHFSLEYII